LACPARFERATYALEAVKMSQNNKLNNSISLARFGVAYATRTLELSGMSWIRLGIGRRQNGLAWNLSGKPTKHDRRSEAANDPKPTVDKTSLELLSDKEQYLSDALHASSC